MSSAVETFGRIVSGQVRTHPRRARTLLAAAYEAVGLAGALPRGGIAGVQERYVGYIAHVVAQGLKRPERSVLVNIYFPHELVDAFGLVPLFPEGVAVYVANTSCSAIFAEIAEECGVPESFCSYHKVMLGMTFAGVIGAPLLIANTTFACDANQVSFRSVAQRTGAPHVVVDVPHDTGEDAVDYVEEQLYGLVAKLEDLTHTALDIERLRQSVRNSRATFDAMVAYRSVRGAASLPTTITGVFCDIVATHCLSADPQSARFLSAMERLALAQQENRAAFASTPISPAFTSMLCTSRTSCTSFKPRTTNTTNTTNTPCTPRHTRKPRIFWVHTLPNWQLSMRAIFDGAERAEVVGTDIPWDSGMQADADHPFRSLARRMVSNVSNGPALLRIERAVALAKEAKADGALIFCHWGCKQTLGLSQLMKEAFEAQGMPALVLDGDGCDPRNVAEGQMVTRVDAFIEQLERGICG